MEGLNTVFVFSVDERKTIIGYKGGKTYQTLDHMTKGFGDVYSRQHYLRTPHNSRHSLILFISTISGLEGVTT